MDGKNNTDIIKNLTKSELEVFAFLNKNSDRLLAMTIEEVAEKCFVSNATITRTAKKMGYRGFTELKYSLVNKKNQDKKIFDIDYSTIRLNDINNSIDLIDKQDLNKVINMFYNKRVYFFGKGLSSLVCEYAVTQLIILGLPVTHLADAHTALAYVDYMTSNDAVFIISNSGNNKQCIDLAIKAKKKDAKVISLTNSNINDLSRLSDISYNVIISKDERVNFDNDSRVPMLLFVHKIIDLLLENKGWENIFSLWKFILN